MQKLKHPLLLIFALLSFSVTSLYGKEIHLKENGRNKIQVSENSYQKLKVDFRLNDLTSTDITSAVGNFSELSIEGFSSRLGVGLPKLPVSRSLIEIPLGAELEVKLLVTTYTEYTLAELGINFPIIPVQPPVAKNDKPLPPFAYNKKAYRQNAFDGEKLVSVDELGIMRNTNMGRLNIAPIQYNPKTGKIRVYDEIKFEIIFKHPDLQATTNLKREHASPAFSNLSKQLLNAKLASATEENLTHYPVSYVIVAPPAFQSILQSFVAWKTKKGFKVIEAYTNDPLVGNSTTSIKTYLENLYNQGTIENPSFSYVLLVGDVAQVPAFPGSGHVTDFYYAEYTGDMLPEVYIGRFSATNETELLPQISKTLEYEKYLMPDPSYLDEVVMIAGMDPSFGPIHGNGQINYGTSYYFNAAHNLNSHTYLYPASGSSAAQIIQDVSNGVGYANYTAHGSSAGWADPSFTVGDIDGLQNNHKYPLMVGNCCSTSTFDEPNCFGEAIMRASNKGAIGYIGASNSSYWDEDFYWGVGFKSIVLNPTWTAGQMGAYDGAFHEHGESFPDWFTSQGQMVVAGNLAVTTGSPGSSSYYWEIYHLMGDPSLMAYFSVPAPMTATFNALIPLGSPTFAVTTIPYAYAAITKGNVLYGAALADSNGICNIPLLPITSPGYVSLVITAQNYEPYFDSVMVATPAGPYVMLNNYVVNEIGGNANGQLDFNENAVVDVTLKNWGQMDASPVSATISTTDAFVTITDASQVWGLIANNASNTQLAAFAFTVADNVPDQHKILFTMVITDGTNSWSSELLVNVNAPKFNIAGVSINDNAGGNGNGRLDPGETVIFEISTTNIGHAPAPLSIGNLTTSSSLVTINTANFALNTVSAGSTVIASYTAFISVTAQTGDFLPLDFMVSSGQYNALKSFLPAVGLILEDWETTDFSRFNWQAPGPNPWFIDANYPFEGLYSVRSGVITDNQTTVLSLTADVLMEDTMSFYYKVSSENTYDFLRFYVNGAEITGWSGDVPWSQYTYNASPGVTTFKWAYEKDASESGGSDAAWVDYIDFPPMAAIVTGVNPVATPFSGVRLYPNPTHNNATIVFFLEKSKPVDLRVFDALGSEVKVILSTTNLAGGAHSYSFDASVLPKGIYFLKFSCDGNVTSRKLLVN